MSTFGCASRNGATHRHHHEINRRRRRVDAQPSRRHLAQAPHSIERLAHVADGRRDARQQHFAGLGERNAARGAVQQPHAEMLFQRAQPLAQARHGDALLARSAAEIFHTRHRGKGIEIAEIHIHHCSI
jgi:hypothetical protein